MSDFLSIYIHIPFCKSRCNYCDFVTYAGKTTLIPAYLEALTTEIELTAQRNKIHQPIDTIYLGGGTPSLLSTDQLTLIMSTLKNNLFISEDAEVTIEVNPGDCNEPFASGIRQIGFNRVSLGLQSAVDSELKSMGRRHQQVDTIAAVSHLKQAGFKNISMDLIFGYPDQTLTSWVESIHAALALNPQHISLYALGVEEQTPLGKQITSGQLKPKRDTYFSDAYAKACEELASAGFRHYEISNWSLSEQYDSRHNSKTWQLEPYLGFGAGAHGYYDGFRTLNLASIEGYVKRLKRERDTGNNQFPAVKTIQKQTSLEEQQNYLIFGLRQLEKGINPLAFQSRFGVRLEDTFRKPLERLLIQKAIHYQSDGNLVIDPKLAFVSNQIFVEFI